MNGIKQIFTGLVLAAGVMLTQPVMAAGPAPIDLESCANFTILAGSGITFAGAVNSTTNTGDIGTYPTVSITGLGNVVLNGVNHAGDEVTQDAKNDLVTAYTNAAGRSATTSYGAIFDLGGLTLTNGVYKDPTSFGITGTLTLDAQGNPDAVWIFQAGSTLITASGSKVALTNGAQACNVFWQVGSSATLGTYSVFKGTIMALESITINTGSIMEGRALARDAAVTLDNNIVSLPKSSQAITNFIPINGSAFDATNKVGLSAQASSGLAVTNFIVISGPGEISGLTNLTFTNSGSVSVTADQSGDNNWNAAPTVTNTFNVTKATATLTLNSLAQIYNGAARSVTATTEPADLSVTITYDGHSWAPTNAGSYAVVATITDANYLGSTNGTLTVGVKTLTITANVRNKIYGTTLELGTTDFTVVGLEAGDTVTGVTLASGGAAAGATVAGSPYAITPSAALGTGLGNYTIGYVNGNLTVGTASLTITAEGKTKVYGAALPELTASYTGFVNGDTAASLDTPVSLATAATAASPVANYDITASGAADANYTITHVKGTLAVDKADQAITNFIPINGSAFDATNKVGLSAQASSGLAVTNFIVISGPGEISGLTNLTFTNSGSVSVTASQPGDTNWNAAPDMTNAYSVLPAGMLGQTITNFLSINGSTFEVADKVGLSAQASSLLLVSFAVKSGPAAITTGTNLAFASTGLVSIVASQVGNMFYGVAPNVTNTFTVTTPLSAEPGMLAVQVTPVSGSWRLTAPAGYTGPTSGTGNLTAASAVVGAYGIAYGALSGYLAPTNQTQFVIVGVTSLFAGVYLQVSTSITAPVVTATEGTYTNKVRISWPSGPGVIGYEIWKSQTNDVNTAARIVEVPDYGADTFQYDDYDVVPLRSYYYWGSAKTATQASPMSLVTMGYAALDPAAAAGTADITASDMVFLPVNVTNLTTAGTVSFWLGNLGPDPLNSAEVAFDFRVGNNDATMVLLGTDQRVFNLVAGQEELVILTAQAKRGLVVPATLSGVKQVQVTVRHGLTARAGLNGVQQVKVVVRHLSALNDPDLANNTTTAAGTVLVRSSGVNSPGRSFNDYDGDGKADGAIYRASDGRWNTVLSGGRYQVWLTAEAGLAGLTPVPGDYDGDGITDLAVYNSLNGWWMVLFSSTDQIISGPLGGPGFTPAPCDFDGDAMTDPVVYREIDGTWYGAASSEGYAVNKAFLGGIGYQPVFGDYDADGLADPAVYDRTTGLWGIAFSSSGYQVMAGTFGGLGYLPVNADYDGDGLTDPAIYAPLTAEWQVLLSGSLATQGGYTWWGGVVGTIGGMPVPADYDGDGKADMAVYHQDTGIWELFLSTQISMQNYQELSGGFGGPQYQSVTE